MKQYKEWNQINVVYETMHHSMFTSVIGNRKLDSNNLRRLEESIRKNGQIVPAIVNERLEIIDGQTRRAVCAKLGLPFQFVIKEGLNIQAVQTVNTDGKKWTMMDYLDMYVKLGNQNYLNVQYFMGAFPDLTLMNIREMLGDKRRSHVFEKGGLKVNPDTLKEGTRLANALRDVSKYYRGYNKRSFVKAYMICLHKEGFDHNRFINKLTSMRSELYDCTTLTRYLERIEYIYNYKEQGGNTLKFY